MPLLADENTPYLETPAERMRRLLGQNTQGVAPGIAGSSPSTRTTVPRSQLPAWVQQRLREQEAATPPAPQAVAPLRPLGPSADPRARADRLREILESPIRGTAPGIAGNPSLQPTTRATPVSYADDPYFDDQIAQDDRAAYSPRTPSTYRTQRAEEQLWAAEPGVGLGGGTGTEGAYEQARRMLDADPYALDPYFDQQVTQDERAARSLAPSAYAAWRENERILDDEIAPDVRASVNSGSESWNAMRRLNPSLEPLPDPASEEPWILPESRAGVPVTVDRKAVHIAYRIRSGFGSTPAERAYLAALPKDELTRVEALAEEFWVGAQAWEFGRTAFDEPMPPPSWEDEQEIFELATGQPYPDIDWPRAVARDLVGLRNGYTFLDYFTSSDRDGALLVYAPALQGDDDFRKLSELLNADYRDERARFDALHEAFPLTFFVPDRRGGGTVLEEGIRGIPVIGGPAAKAAGKALSPITWLGGPTSGLASIGKSVVANTLYESFRDSGASSEESLAGTEMLERYLAQYFPQLKLHSWKGPVWAYAADSLGTPLDDFGPEWMLVAPRTYPAQEAWATLSGEVGSMLSQIEDDFAGRDLAASHEQRMSDIWTFQQQRNYEARNALETLALQAPSDSRDEAMASLYSELYWSTVPEKDRVTGRIAWESWEARRHAIGREAERLGFDLNYVIGTGPGTYHDLRFVDPAMRDAIQSFERTVFANP